MENTYLLKSAQVSFGDEYGTDISLASDDADSTETHISIVSGPNGTSKSRVLASIVNFLCKVRDGKDTYPQRQYNTSETHDQIGSRRHCRGSRPVHHGQRHPAFCAVQLSPGGERRRVARNHLIDTTMKEAALSGAQRSPEDMSRVKSLVRLKNVSDELRLRAQTAQTIGLQELARVDRPDEPGSVLLVDGRASSQERLTRALKPIADVAVISDPQAALFEAAESSFDLIIVNANFDDYDPLRLCSQLRSLERTRFIPILLVTEQGNDERIVRALELGVTDYIMTAKSTATLPLPAA